MAAFKQFDFLDSRTFYTHLGLLQFQCTFFINVMTRLPGLTVIQKLILSFGPYEI